MTIWFIADTHFGHANIIRLAERPFASVEEMDEAMIANWNEVVRAGDEVWHLGDFAWGNRGVAIFPRLNGVKHLILGNHDHEATELLRWENVFRDYFMNVGGVKLHLYHYPLREWDAYWRGAIHLHGHVHGKLPDMPGAMDVGVERIGYRPVSLEQVTEAQRRWLERKVR